MDQLLLSVPKLGINLDRLCIGRNSLLLYSIEYRGPFPSKEAPNEVGQLFGWNFQDKWELGHRAEPWQGQVLKIVNHSRFPNQFYNTLYRKHRSFCQEKKFRIIYRWFSLECRYQTGEFYPSGHGSFLLGSPQKQCWSTAMPLRFGFSEEWIQQHTSSSMSTPSELLEEWETARSPQQTAPYNLWYRESCKLSREPIHWPRYLQLFWVPKWYTGCWLPYWWHSGFEEEPFWKVWEGRWRVAFG